MGEKNRVAGINISVGAKTVKAVGKVILKILKAKVDQETMKTAISVLGSCSSVHGANICSNSVRFDKEE